MVEENAAPTVKIQDSMLISDLETLKVLADPLRLSILEYLVKPSTVKRIAEKLDKPPTKLYYHFNLLEQHGLIQLVDTRIVSGIIEKHYQASARSYQVARGLLAPGSTEQEQGFELTLSGILTDARNDAIESRHAGLVAYDEDAPSHKKMLLGQLRLMLTNEQAVDFRERLIALVDEFKHLSKANEESGLGAPYKGLLIFHRSARTLDTTSTTESPSVTDTQEQPRQ